jgi:hypothetical protein
MRRLGTLLVVLAAALFLVAGYAQTKDQIRFQEQITELEKGIERAGTPEEREEARRALVDYFIGEADRLIDDRNYRSKSTEHYRVFTDDPRVNIDSAAELLESFGGFFESFWKGRAELQPYESTSRAYLFYSFFKYNQLLTGDPRFSEFRPPGHYRPVFDVLLVYSDSVPPAELADVLVHEAAHQLVRQRLYGARSTPGSLWAEEGLASYFAFTRRDKKGRFEAGRIGEKRVELIDATGSWGGAAPRAQLGRAKRLARSKSGWALEDLIRFNDPQAFYGEGAEDRYAAAWLLVHYLFHADGGAHAGGFVRYLGEEAAGRGGADAFYETLGVGPAELESSYRRYVSKLKAR